MLDLLNDLKKTVSAFNNQKATFNNRDGFYNTVAWTRTRAYIVERDNYECQPCKRRGLVSTADHTTLIVHHIEPLEYALNKALDHDNLITVCIGCHNYIHGNAFTITDSQTKWQDEWW